MAMIILLRAGARTGARAAVHNPGFPGPPIAAVVLAAGASSRLGSPKALLRRGGVSAVQQVVATAAWSGCTPCVVVVRPNAPEVQAAAKEARVPVEIVESMRPETGRTGSAKRGIIAAKSPAALIWPVDRPAAHKETERRLIELYKREQSEVIVPVHGGKRGHPIIIAGRALWEVVGLDDNAPLHEVVHSDSKRVREVAVDDPGILVNLDTKEAAGAAGWEAPL